jgi:hypothetical protein
MAQTGLCPGRFATPPRATLLFARAKAPDLLVNAHAPLRTCHRLLALRRRREQDSFSQLQYLNIVNVLGIFTRSSTSTRLRSYELRRGKDA